MVLWHWVVGLGMGLVAAIVTLRAIENSHPSSGQYRRKHTNFRQTPNDRCPVCLESMKNEDMQYLLCCHALHDKCLQELKKHSRQCPICRADI